MGDFCQINILIVLSSIQQYFGIKIQETLKIGMPNNKYV